LILVPFLSACIGEDIVDDRVPELLTVSNPVDSIQVGTSYQFEATYLNEVGQKESANLVWVSSNESILTVNTSGLAQALSTGNVDITVSLEGRLDISDVIKVNAGMTTSVVNNATERTGSLRTTSSYALSGDFILINTGSNLELQFADNFVASSALPGLYVYLTNNASTNNGALELGMITKFTGVATFSVPAEVEINDFNFVLFYCKPFSVKVGDGSFEN